jgi:hypothetical protein
MDSLGKLPSVRHGTKRPRSIPGSTVEPQLTSEDAQRLWIEVHRRQWSSLVLVPADPGGSAGGIATSLANAGAALGDPELRVVNAEGMGVEAIRGVIADLKLMADLSTRAVSATTGNPWRVVVTVESVLSNPLGIMLAQAADAALLCVRKRKTKLSAARKTVELIGRDLFIGSVVLVSGRR